MPGPSDSARRLTGGCQCGAVRYRLDVAPTHASVCYCRMCQKASGQPLMAFARVPLSALRWTKGEPGLFRSSSLVVRHFCRDCGTPLTYRYLEGPNISVTACSLDDPEAAPPQMQYGLESEVSWLAGIRTLPGTRTQDDQPPDRLSRMVSLQHPDRPGGEEAS